MIKNLLGKKAQEGGHFNFIIMLALVVVVVILVLVIFGSRIGQGAEGIFSLLGVGDSDCIKTKAPCKDCLYISEYCPSGMDFTSDWEPSDSKLGANSLKISFSKPLSGDLIPSDILVIYNNCEIKPASNDEWYKTTANIEMTSTSVSVKNIKSGCYYLIQISSQQIAKDGSRIYPGHEWISFQT